MANYISKIKIGNSVYEIKDSVARQGGLVFHLATNAANTPAGVAWDDDGTLITGTLTAWDGTQPRTGIYLVKSLNGTNDTYDEYVAVSTADPATQSATSWEKLGDTELDISDIANKLKATPTLTKDKVLGESTTFTNSNSSVTFSGGTSDTFVKSYPGTSSKLETATITGVKGEDSFTATNTVLGTNTSASKVTTESKTATKVSFGTATTASKATAGTAVNVAKVASSATAVSYIGNASTNSILEKATYDSTTETLELSSVSVTQGSVTGTNGTQSITPYTFADVTVPNITAHSDVTVASVKTNTDVTVPVITSNASVTKTFATKGGDQVVATGSLDADDTVGATVMTGLGTPTTASAIKTLGTGTAAAQAITVGTNDKVDAVTNVTVAIEPNTGA